MSNGLVKLIAVAGAIGVGLLVVFQIQKGLTTPRFTVSDAVETELDVSSPRLTNLDSSPPESPPAKSQSLAEAFGESAPLASQPSSNSSSEPAASDRASLGATASPAASARGLSFKDDETDLVDPFGSDPTAVTEDTVAPPDQVATPADALPDPATNPLRAAPGVVRLVSGDDSDPDDPFAEALPPARKPAAASVPLEIPDDDFPRAGRPALAAPGRASLSDDSDLEAEMESDPFGAEPPPLRRLEATPPEPLLEPGADNAPFGDSPESSLPPAIRPSGPPTPTVPRIPSEDSDFDPFAAEERPVEEGNSRPALPLLEDLVNELPPARPAIRESLPAPALDFESDHFNAEPALPAVEPSPAAPDLPVLRRGPAPAGDLLHEEEPSLPEREPLSNESELAPRSRSLPDPEPVIDEPESERTEPLRLMGEQETSPADDLSGDGTVRDGVPRGEQQPRLTIRKLAPPQATLGQPLIYEVLVRNIGDVAAHQVIVEDRIPRGSRLTGTIPRAEMLDKRLFWKLGTLGPGEERKISIRVIPEEEGSIGSVAKVNFVAEIAAEIVVTAPQLSLKVECPAQARMGDAVDMKFIIRNSGNGDASNVVLRDILPAGLQHPAGSDLENAIGDLAAGETRELTLQLTAADSGLLENQAILTADGGLKVEQMSSIEVVGERLKLTRKGQAKVYVGRAAVYSYTISNEGKQAVNQAMVIEEVPAGFDFIEASDGGRFESQTRTVTWILGAVQPGETREVSAKFSARTTGEYSSRVQLTGASGSIASIQGQVSVAGMPALSIDSPGNDRIVAVGEQLISKVVVQNRGTASAENLELVVNLPPELKLVDARGPSRFRREGQAVIFDPVPTVTSRAKATYELTLEAVAEGDTRLELQISADHLSRPVHREEVVQVVTGGR